MLEALSVVASRLIDTNYVVDDTMKVDYIISIVDRENESVAVKTFSGIITEQNICDFILKSPPYHRHTLL
jgi:hypothetical protein